MSSSWVELGWCFSFFFSPSVFNMPVEASQSLAPLYIKASPLWERRFWMHPMCAATIGGSWLCVLDCELWQTRDYESGFHLNAPKPDTNERSQSHMAASKAASAPRPPSHFLLSFLPPHFHPLLMCDTLILNILFLVFWLIGFTCRWVCNLHRLKGLPSLLMLSDNAVSIHPLCRASLPGHRMNCCLMLLQVSFYTAGSA